MAFCELHYFSKALGMQTAANVLLPEGDQHKGPFPVFYLLHGLSDDHTIWLRRTSIERYVQSLPLIVVMPSGGRGFYSDAREGFAYDTALTRDLVGYIDQIFPTRAERGGRCIGGLSMGGYGAIKLALTHPDLFCSANSHSGALGFGHKPLSGDDAFAVEMRRIVGDAPQGGPHDLHALIEKLDPTKLPALRIDCGTEDFLIEDNRAFHAHLVHRNIRHEYDESPGAHEWSYWDQHVQAAIAFHRKQLGI